MENWIYFATSDKASLAATIEVVLNAQFLWRPAFNEIGAHIANVKSMEPGDRIILAWRHAGLLRRAYLQCTVAAPLSPVARDLVIDKLIGPGVQVLMAAGYSTNSEGAIEGIRLDKIQECYFEVQGKYGGNNAIHKLSELDVNLLSAAASIPPDALEKSPRRSTPIAAALRVPRPTIDRSGVDRVTLEATSPDRVFDAYVMVDWSSSSTPVTGNDSIWVGSGAWDGPTFTAESPKNVSTRLQAVELLRKQLQTWQKEGKKVLVGFDFAFGYPAGFAHALGLTSSSKGAWKALHEFFAANVTDSPSNENNRDSFAHECNRRVGAPGPFWGCGAKAATRFLTQQRVGVFEFPHRELDEWRVTDLAARRQVTTQSVWKLNCGVSVGGQTILGIKHLADLACEFNGQRWPFDGWGTPDKSTICFAEIFPSLIRYPEWNDEYKSRRDRTQVQSCVRYAAERDSMGLLKKDFDKPNSISEEDAAKIENEEGWILWVDRSALDIR